MTNDIPADFKQFVLCCITTFNCVVETIDPSSPDYFRIRYSLTIAKASINQNDFRKFIKMHGKNYEISDVIEFVADLVTNLGIISMVKTI